MSSAMADPHAASPSQSPSPAPASSPASPETEAALWTPPPLPQGQVLDPLEALRAVPLFEALSTSQLKKIARLLHHRTYQPGEVIFREGDPGAGMYLISRGAVRIVIRLPDGAERELALLTERQFFGEMALLDDVPRSASAVAVQRTELLGFFEPELESLVERDSRLGSRILWNLARLMASRLRTTNEALRALRPAGGGR